mmetsp:Transcript_10903/g.33748  ORF Transcript_10903/g.33748 Transcript_10903/m.33748 type:complete len:217 (-) Transcript_10903:17-667(-)|eukprot:CAMPEP_0174848226 /NCGR_PEP_ID=MMETSP1114-20130205/13397_1 /TAXON_ID=312471 /ORGANISM="Neobodo designis, Strain CCAP 1951/1" /LENGTH=216 /DNA_ID=CAMNT_0016082525 /DNA_START=59 /DNA_END=709 /DNA_ORIENTATION=+
MSATTDDWEVVDPGAAAPDTFATVADVVGLVMEFCDTTSLLRMRLACRSWAHNAFLNWPQTLALVKERHRLGTPITLPEAIRESDGFSFDLLIDIGRLEAQPRQQPVVVQEHQRFFPVVGWCSRRLPGDPPTWVQLTGAHSGEIHDPFAACTDGGHWAGDWAPIINENTDAHGWQFAVGYKTRFGPRHPRASMVRRRQWIRMLVTDGTPPPSSRAL